MKKKIAMSRFEGNTTFAYPVKWRGQKTVDRLSVSLDSIKPFVKTKDIIFLTDSPQELVRFLNKREPSFRVFLADSYANALHVAAIVSLRNGAKERVVWMNDDIVWLGSKSNREKFFEVLHTRHRLPDHLTTTRWIGSFAKTKKSFKKLVEKKGIEVRHDYSTHRPYVYEAKKMMNLFYDLGRLDRFKKIPFEDAYFNKFKKDSIEKEAIAINYDTEAVDDFGAINNGLEFAHFAKHLVLQNKAV
jgi:hypothetical protein